MEFELCTIKCEETDIFDVELEQEELVFEDEKPIIGLDQCELDVQAPDFCEDICHLKNDTDGNTGDPELSKTVEGDYAQQNSLKLTSVNYWNLRKKGKMVGGNKVMKKKRIQKNEIKNCHIGKSEKLITGNSQNTDKFPTVRQSYQNKLNNKEALPEKAYSCTYCDFQTCFYHLLTVHLRRHRLHHPWACSKCKFSCMSEFSFHRHVRNMHERPKKITCNKCDYRCRTSRELKNHMLVHFNKNYFKCSECDFKALTLAVMKRHSVKHMDIEHLNQLMCVVCGYKGVKPEYLKKHMEKHHRFVLDFENSFGGAENVKENFDINLTRGSESHLMNIDNMEIIKKQPLVILRRCDDNVEGACNSSVNMGLIHNQILQDNFFDVAKFGEPEEVIGSEMLNSSHKEDDSTVVLKSSLVTKNKNIISSIIKVVENENSIPLPPFARKSKRNNVKEKVLEQLKSKQGALTESVPITINEVIYNKSKSDSLTAEIYRCRECSFVSSWFDQFEKHSKLHIEKCFSCDECDFVTNYQMALARHKRSNHRVKKNFKCETCHYRCSSAESLKKHIRSHENINQFKCNKCKAKCKSADDFKRHMATHEKNKPFFCNLCNFRTRFKISLKNHMFIHTGETKFVCIICDYKFYSNSSLKKHTMNVHM